MVVVSGVNLQDSQSYVDVRGLTLMPMNPDEEGGFYKASFYWEGNLTEIKNITKYRQFVTGDKKVLHVVLMAPGEDLPQSGHRLAKIELIGNPREPQVSLRVSSVELK